MTQVNRRFRLAILRNEMGNDHLRWLDACAYLADRVEFDVINLMRDDWSQRVSEGNYDGLLAQPTGWSAAMKALYDERVALLDRNFGLPMIPSWPEIAIYENKRALAHWLKDKGVPHPASHVFESAADAIEFLRSAVYPLVAKTSTGAGGSGVRILHSASEAMDYVDRTFHGAGAPRYSGPKWRGRGLAVRAIRKLAHPSALIERIREYRTVQRDVQRDHVLFQAFIPHSFEWRAVRIGDSYFAHKKLVKGHKASGSLLKEYGDPPKDLLDLVRRITDAHGFRSVAIDAFEAPDGGYLVNEIQCLFGQSDPYQMTVDGVPGRYRWINGTWVFEAGDFNRFESYLLRLEYLLEVIASAPSRTPLSPGA